MSKWQVHADAPIDVLFFILMTGQTSSPFAVIDIRVLFNDPGTVVEDRLLVPGFQLTRTEHLDQGFDRILTHLPANLAAFVLQDSDEGLHGAGVADLA